MAIHLPASRCPLEDGLCSDQGFMTRFEYELLREQEPQLHLPSWIWLDTHKRLLGRDMIERIEELDREALIASRTAVLLSSETPELRL